MNFPQAGGKAQSSDIIIPKYPPTSFILPLGTPFLPPRSGTIHITVATFHSISKILAIIGTGFGMALMYSIVDIGSIILQNGINGFGEDIIAAHVAARKIFSVTMQLYKDKA